MISTKLRNSAKGQDCTFAIPGVCNHDPETTVLCHLYPDGRAMGAKSPDYVAAFGCVECHTAIDQHQMSKEDEIFYSFRAVIETWAIWIAKGLIVLPVDPVTAKRRPQKKWKRQSAPMAGTKASGVRKRMNGTVENREASNGT